MRRGVVLLTAALALAACTNSAPSTPTSPTPPSLDGTWVITSAHDGGEAISLDDWPDSSLPRVRFGPSITGWTGCNSFEVFDAPGYTLADGILVFDDIVVENAGCEGRLDEVEQFLIGFLWARDGFDVAFVGDQMRWIEGAAEVVWNRSAEG